MSIIEIVEPITYGCTVDRVGRLRILHVFGEVSLRTAGRLLEVIDRVALETTGGLILSLLESHDVEAEAVREILRRTPELHERLTLVGPPDLTGTADSETPTSFRTASCFGEVFS